MTNEAKKQAYKNFMTSALAATEGLETETEIRAFLADRTAGKITEKTTARLVALRLEVNRRVLNAWADTWIG